MNKEYVDAVLKNESKVDPKTGAPFSDGMRLLHAHMGIITEVGEITDLYKKNIFYGKPIDETHLKKEIGDLLWYTGLGLHLNQFDFGDVHVFECKTILEAIRRISIVNQFDCELTSKNLIALLGGIKAMINMLGFDYEEILRLNTAKLNARYENGFSSKEAINRKEGDV